MVTGQPAMRDMYLWVTSQSAMGDVHLWGTSHSARGDMYLWGTSQPARGDMYLWVTNQLQGGTCICGWPASPQGVTCICWWPASLQGVTCICWLLAGLPCAWSHFTAVLLSDSFSINQLSSASPMRALNCRPYADVSVSISGNHTESQTCFAVSSTRRCLCALVEFRLSTRMHSARTTCCLLASTIQFACTFLTASEVMCRFV